jgi:hypothetical protein
MLGLLRGAPQPNPTRDGQLAGARSRPAQALIRISTPAGMLRLLKASTV